jgi:hypothetical protein
MNTGFILLAEEMEANPGLRIEDLLKERNSCGKTFYGCGLMAASRTKR